MNVTIKTTNELDNSIKGMTAPFRDGYVVFLNGNAPRSEQLVSLLHEICHIWRGDMGHDANVGELETSCHDDLVTAAQIILAERSDELV